MHVHIQPDFEDIKTGMAKKKGKKAGGFMNLETSSMSMSFMSGMLGFDEMDNGECDETTEEDLRMLKDKRLEFELSERIKLFLDEMVVKDEQYMRQCISRLCAKELKILKSDLKIDI